MLRRPATGAKVSGATAIAFVALLAYPGGPPGPSVTLAAGGDRKYCCWRIDVQARGELSANFVGRRSPDPADQGFYQRGDLKGDSKFNFVWKSRGLYRYRELGRGREPSFDNLLDAGKSLARLTERSGYCVYGPPLYRTGPDGEPEAWSQDCRSDQGYPCISRQRRPWRRGSGVQVFGLSGSRFITVDFGNDFPPDTKCAARQHLTSDVQDHRLKGPTQFDLPVARRTRAALRRRRTFSPRPFPFNRHLVHADDAVDQPHTVDIKQMVTIKGTYFPTLRLRAERRALGALR